MPPHDHERHDRPRPDPDLSDAIIGLTHVLRDLTGFCSTQKALHQLEDNLTMKLNEIKAAITTASRQNKEALQELGTKIADLNQKIDELTEAATNPDVTDEQFLADLASLQSDAAALAEIVPGSVSDGSGQTPTDPVDPTPLRRV